MGIYIAFFVILISEHLLQSLNPDSTQPFSQKLQLYTLKVRLTKLSNEIKPPKKPKKRIRRNDSKKNNEKKKL